MIDEVLAMRNCHRMTKAAMIAATIAALTMTCAQMSAAAVTVEHRRARSVSPAQATVVFGLSLMRRLSSGNPTTPNGGSSGR
jgi:hypothetical protein